MNKFSYLIKNILIITDNIYGSYLLDLINNINYKISSKDRFNKGFIGNFIEFYINSLFNKNNFCDIFLINLEIKTFSLNYKMELYNDIYLISIKYNKFLNLYIIKKILSKIKNILFIPVLGYKNYFLENKIIGKSFLLKFNNNEILNFYKEFNLINDYIINNLYIKINNFYTKSFRLQFNYNNNINNLKIFFKKEFMLTLISKYKIIL